MVDNVQSKTPYLDQFTENITEKIKRKPANFTVFGRDKEVKQVLTSLMRLTKNSPLLIGEPGVGKTAIIDGLVVEILNKRVPKEFQNVTVRSLEMATLESNDGEPMISKLKKIVEELKRYKDTELLFIDEVHTIVGTGNSNSMMDAGNALKPALARGEIQMIGATTLDEYQMSIETDPALERRFQNVMVEEPTRDEAVYILERVKKRFENERNTPITQEAVEAAVDLSIRYIPERFLPDKAIDLVDDALAQAYFEGKEKVTEREIARVVEKVKKIPVTTILKDDQERFHDIEGALRKRVKGQDQAIAAIANSIYKQKEGLQKSNRPLGTFLFLGTTGVGKTELAKALAEIIFNSEDDLIRLDCSEFSSEGDKDKLIGGNKIGSKGILTEKVKNNPYSIVLFDEIEKADPSVWDLLLQVLDDGRLSTGLGRMINFKNTIVIATTNLGADEIKSTYATQGNFGDLSERELEAFIQRIEEDLTRKFRPEFINRFSAKIVFNMLTEEIIDLIVRSKMKKELALFSSQNITLLYENEEMFFDYLRSKGTSVQNGARPLERVIEDKIIAPISKKLFEAGRRGREATVTIRVIGEKPDGYHTFIDYRSLDFDVEIEPYVNFEKVI